MSAPTKDLCVIEFSEHTTFAGMYKRMLNAVSEGIIAFRFQFAIKDKRTGKVRKFVEQWAWHPNDPIEALEEMARDLFEAFTNTAAGVISGRLPQKH